MSFYVYETTTKKEGEVEMTETNAERLERIKANWRFRDEDDNWLIEQAERARYYKGLHGKRSVQLERRNIEYRELEDENKRLREVLEELRVLVLHCDSDERAIQPYEVGDIVNKALDGVNHETTKT